MNTTAPPTPPVAQLCVLTRGICRYRYAMIRYAEP